MVKTPVNTAFLPYGGSCVSTWIGPLVHDPGLDSLVSTGAAVRADAEQQRQQSGPGERKRWHRHFFFNQLQGDALTVRPIKSGVIPNEPGTLDPGIAQ